MTDELKAEREVFEKWMESLNGFPFARQFSNLMWQAWQAREKLDRTHTTSTDVVRDAKSGLQPISTAPEKTVVVAAWVDEDGCTRYEFDFKEDGVWFEHNERYEHYLSCAPRDIPCSGPSEEAPYTHWLELPIIDAAMAAKEGGE